MKDNSKVMASLEDAIKAAHLKDGMTISFHHHLRNGDYVLNMVLAVIAKLGIKNLTINASSLMGVHRPLIEHIKNGVVKALECDYMDIALGDEISHGLLPEPVIFRSHGGRPADIMNGYSHIDVAFIAAPCADEAGNLNGSEGKSAFGSIGYAMADAQMADYVVVITDNLKPYPLQNISIDETLIDAVVVVDSIGDPDKIVSGTTKVTRDPVGLLMADTAVDVIRASGLLQDGFSFQTGAGGASLAVADKLASVMAQEKIVGSFASGGITGLLVDMLDRGLFRSLLDVQCFDKKAAQSIAENPKHVEISASRYASPEAASCVTDKLDVVILGATEVDQNFNVNVHTNSSGVIMGGSGGHSDTAAGAKMSVIIAPLLRARLPLVVDRVDTISTPGEDIDVVVTQFGVAVNPRRDDLLQRFCDYGIHCLSIAELQDKAQKMAGVPQTYAKGDKTVGIVRSRYGKVLDEIKAVL